MNNVSIFIYASDVCGNLAALMVIVAIVSSFISVVSICGGLDSGEEGWIKFGKRWALGAFVSALLVVLLPNKTTLYAIAASQLGEAVVKSPEGKEIIDDTKQILREYLKLLKGEKK